MDDRAALERENEALRERLARLHEAGTRIAEELDLDVVLGEVMEAARALTGARFSGITLLDEAGELEQFITPEFSQQQYQAVMQMPGGEAFFRHLHGLEGPLRLDDLGAYIESLGLGPFPLQLGGYCCLPIRHRGRHVASIHLSDKRDGAGFTAEDEETLGLFAQQAAIAIANARRMRDERRARADLETLVETSPVGVVLFDAHSGTMLSHNREARRIVESLRDPEQSHDDLLGVLSHRRADGRRLDPSELALARALSSGETVRAEEIALEAPDGRRISVIVNATPIRDESGTVESVVVTLQDLAGLEEQARMRTEFLGMVSHELRLPLTSIKGSVATLLAAEEELDPAEARQFHRIIEQQTGQMETLITDLLDVARIDSGELAVRPEPVALEALVEAALAGFRTAGGRHDVQIDLPEGLDRVLVERRRIVQVLVNLLTNAARHSPGAAAIRLMARPLDVELQVTVADDGIGIEAERLKTLFQRRARAGWRSSDEREPASGLDSDPGPVRSGLGLAIARGIVEAHGGRIWAESEGPGEGAQFHFTLPAVEPAALPPEPGSTRPARGQFRILALDDDPQILVYLRHTLEEAGFDPVLTGDHEALRPLIAEHRPHLVLLDLVLPESDGMELMQLLPELQDRSVIFLSAYGGDERIARALELGADDYIVKPFSPTELVARIRTVLRRTAAGQSGPPRPSGVYRYAELEIDYAEQQVALAGRPLELTYLEERLLVELSKRAGDVLSHAQLLPRVWGPAHSGRTGAVRTLVKQLRRKLGDEAEQPTYIFNVPRLGYRMPESELAEAAEADD